MPRKSTPSLPAGDTTISTPSNADGLNPPTLDGDASMLSVAIDASTTTTKPRGNGKAAKEDTDSVGLDDLLLPRTLISRLARGILPANTSIQKDALLALTKAATVFISHLAHNANELTQKKTVGPQDVLRAIEEIEMGAVMGLGHVGADGKVGGRLERELEVFENVVKGKRKGYREKVKARESGGSNLNDGGDENGERGPKRPRFEEEDGQDPDQQAASGLEVPATARPSVASQRQYHHHQQQQQQQFRATPPPKDDMPPDDESQDEHDGNAPDEEGSELRSEEDDDDDDDQDGEEDEEEAEERAPEEDDLEGYGPDDQLRHDLDGRDEDEDDDDSD